MVSVIIPALNEGTTLRKVIQRIRQDETPMEIIVVDDNSSDNTVSEALKEGARVVTSSRKGKGISMHEGMMAAANEVIVYLDADILTYPKNIVSLLATPLLNNEADFVKSFFDRQAGRVTQLVAKPLLSIFFPELEKFTQPLSGMIAAKKSFLKEVEFENDYGVDIALLIDAYNKQLRIQEVNIGFIKNDMQSLEALGKMSRQVSRTILRRAALQSGNNLETLSNIHAISDEMDIAITESISKLKKMIVIDMDVLLERSFFEEAAERYNLDEELYHIQQTSEDTAARLTETARLFNGRSLPELQAIADEIPIKDFAEKLMSGLKREGYICILVSDGFDVVAHHIKNKLGFDYAFANHLLIEKSIAIGQLSFPDYFRSREAPLVYKRNNLLPYLTEKFNVLEKNIVFFSNAEEDIPMLQAAGLGIVTRDAPLMAQMSADKILPDGSLKPLLHLLSDKEKNKPLFQRRSFQYLVGAGALVVGAAVAGIYWYNKNKRQKNHADNYLN